MPNIVIASRRQGSDSSFSSSASLQGLLQRGAQRRPPAHPDRNRCEGEIPKSLRFGEGNRGSSSKYQNQPSPFRPSFQHTHSPTHSVHGRTLLRSPTGDESLRRSPEESLSLLVFAGRCGDHVGCRRSPFALAGAVRRL